MRSYADACGITRALDVIGERWALPIVRELVFGPRRYSDLAAVLPGVSTNILGTRLKELTEAGVVSRRRLPPPAAATVYELTAWGAALEPALIAMGRWAAHTPIDLQRQAFSASSFALSLKTTFDPVAATAVRLGVRLVMGEDVFEARIDDGEFTIGRAGSFAQIAATGIESVGIEPVSIEAVPHEQRSRAQVQVEAHPKALAALVYQRLDPAGATAEDVVRIDGPITLVETFASCFALPAPPAPAPASAPAPAPAALSPPKEG